MAKDFLINGFSFAIGCTFTLSSCNSILGHYPTKEPQEVGRTVERLYKEVFTGLIIKPNASSEVSSDYCGEDWDKEKSVTPQSGDPWRVNHNQFHFLVGAAIPIKSGYDAPPVYQALAKHLRKTGGWEFQKNYSTSNLLAGISGEKEGVYLNIHHSPDKDRKIQIYVSLESKCYKHPNT